MNTRANGDSLEAKNRIDCHFLDGMVCFFFFLFSPEMMGWGTSQSMLLFLNMFQAPKGALNLSHMLLHFDATSLERKREISLVLPRLLENQNCY